MHASCASCVLCAVLCAVLFCFVLCTCEYFVRAFCLCVLCSGRVVGRRLVLYFIVCVVREEPANGSKSGVHTLLCGVQCNLLCSTLYFRSVMAGTQQKLVVKACKLTKDEPAVAYISTIAIYCASFSMAHRTSALLLPLIQWRLESHLLCWFIVFSVAIFSYSVTGVTCVTSCMAASRTHANLETEHRPSKKSTVGNPIYFFLKG